MGFCLAKYEMAYRQQLGERSLITRFHKTKTELGETFTGRQPFKPPMVMPRTKYFCTNRKLKSAGPKARTAIAMRADWVGIGIPVVCGFDAMKLMFAINT